MRIIANILMPFFISTGIAIVMVTLSIVWNAIKAYDADWGALIRVMFILTVGMGILMELLYFISFGVYAAWKHEANKKAKRK